MVVLARIGFDFLHARYLVAVAAVAIGCSFAQTASSGAIIGLVVDPSGAYVSEAELHLRRPDGSVARSVQTDSSGQFGVLSVEAGTYSLSVAKPGFDRLVVENIRIHVTETVRVRLSLKLSTRQEEVQVLSNPSMVDLDNPAHGRVLAEESIHNLPLVTRNFTQITTLSPGVIAGVYNAGELGTGGTALSQIGKSNDGIYSHGSRSYDNNWQIDGISVNDVLGSGVISGGIPLPNPDTLQEFKVQTGLYDAGFGRGSGANVAVVTNGGSHDLHGTVFEFLRHDALNANDYFLKQNNRPRPVLKQNQFGFSLGGPIRKDKAFFFGSYQGTRQRNGLAAGQSRIACGASLAEPALTDDRSPAALGQLFRGQSGALGGVAINPDGSNINTVALQLLNWKLSDGSFLIPTPQRVDASKPFASQGFSVFSEPCRFTEDQFVSNLDWWASPKNEFTSRLFVADQDQSVTFPGGALNTAGNIRGFDSPVKSRFLVYSLGHRYLAASTWLSDTKFGYIHTVTESGANAPFKWSDVGVSEGEMNNNNELPSLSILGSLSMASVLPRTYAQDSIMLTNIINLLRGNHTFKFGGTLTRFTADLRLRGAGSFIQFLSWPDFLLGLNQAGNGTGTFSNVFASSDIYGLLDRSFKAWEGSVFAHEVYRVSPGLTFNVGVRYDRIGHFGDDLGRTSSFDVKKADQNPTPSGSLGGYIVASNFPGSVPAGVERAENTFGTYGQGQNAIAPRVGFAWQPISHSTRLTLRGGYGIYYSRPPGQTATQSIIAAPFSTTRISTGAANGAATFQSPFAQPFPTPSSFPQFVPYSPTTNLGINALSPTFRPAMVQQFSLNLQTEVHDGWLVEIGYFGARGTHLQRYRSLNQALNATPDNPVRTATDNTLANVRLRVPVPGIRPDSLREMESQGNSWYNGLETSITKHLAHGLQFLASYTFSKTLDTDGADVNSTAANNALTLGDQNAAGERWGRVSFDRTHRFVFSTITSLPSPSQSLMRAILGGWSIAGIVTIQSGSALTIAATNATNVFGISQDRAQLSGTCSAGQIVNPGPIQSKLDNYFNRSCFAAAPIIGADGIGTGFGNSATGIVNGPGQSNLDIAFVKQVFLPWPRESANLQLRAEFYNVLNHPQFANPDTNFSSPTFGVIGSTSVNSRVGQLALKFTF